MNTTRHCFATDLKDNPELIEKYKMYHKPGNGFPAVAKSIRDAGIVEMEIYLIANRLFMIMEVDDNFDADKNILLVHNTFTNAEDIAFARSYSNTIYWCFCPNANEYIEKQQPDYSLFKNEKCTIGTDSLASNWSLSILDELKTIANKDSSISLETLIKWATFNGAQFLGFSKLGSIEKGKQPGLNLMSNLNGMNLIASSSVKRII